MEVVPFPISLHGHSFVDTGRAGARTIPLGPGAQSLAGHHPFEVIRNVVQSYPVLQRLPENSVCTCSWLLPFLTEYIN